MSEKNKITLALTITIIAILLVIVALIVFRSNDDTEPAEKPINNQAEDSDEKNEDAALDEVPDQGENNVEEDPDADESGRPDDGEQNEDGADENITLPSNWVNLSPREKTELNPYNCDLEKYYVRGDNGRCLGKAPASENIFLTYDPSHTYDATGDVVYEVKVSPAAGADGEFFQCQNLSSASVLGADDFALIESQKTEFNQYIKMIVADIARGSYNANDPSIPADHRQAAEKLVLFFFYEYLNSFGGPSARQPAIDLDTILQLLDNSKECSFNLEVINRGATLWYLNGCDGFEFNDIKINTRSATTPSFAAHTISPVDLNYYLQYAELPVDAVACTQALWDIAPNETVYSGKVHLLVAQDVQITHIEFTQNKPPQTYSVPTE